MVCLTVFQDFLESNRSGYSFYFSESILFKIVWILFIPLLTVLYTVLKKQHLTSYPKIVCFIIAPVIIHILILPFVVITFSWLFYQGRYDFYKILTYTLSNDTYKLVLVYTAFVLGYNLFYGSVGTEGLNTKFFLQQIVINNGKNSTIVHTNEIIQITAATPYLTIETESKKYLHTETLKSISSQLNNDVFVRIHKSAIININGVVSFKSRLNGDYDVLLKNGNEVRLSRTYVATFKKIFKSAHQVTV